MRHTILLTFLLLGCQVRVKTNDSNQRVTFGGESFITVRLEFLQQVHDYCEALYLPSDFASPELYRQAVAECTFDKLSLLNIDLSQIEEFCHQDLTNLTPQEAANITTACEFL